MIYAGLFNCMCVGGDIRHLAVGLERAEMTHHHIAISLL